MEVIIAVIGSAIALVGAAVTVVTMWSHTERQTGELYDKLVRLRIDHPVVMALSRRWSIDSLGKVYAEGQDLDPEFVIYYCYVELCLAYCNAVLVAHRGMRMNPGSFRYYHRPLMKLLLTENHPILEHLAQNGKYLSRLLMDFRNSLTSEGWNWEHEHRQLAE